MANTQTPCINDTVLQLAEEAVNGDVFIYSDNVYQWTARSEAWEGIMLTKTERGFEMIDKNGRSRKIVNLGSLPNSEIECTSCTKPYVYTDAVECINALCCGQDAFVGSCAEVGISVGWCDFESGTQTPTIDLRFAACEGDLVRFNLNVYSDQPYVEIAYHLDGIDVPPQLYLVVDGVTLRSETIQRTYTGKQLMVTAVAVDADGLRSDAVTQNYVIPPCPDVT